MNYHLFLFSRASIFIFYFKSKGIKTMSIYFNKVIKTFNESSVYLEKLYRIRKQRILFSYHHGLKIVPYYYENVVRHFTDGRRQMKEIFPSNSSNIYKNYINTPRNYKWGGLIITNRNKIYFKFKYSKKLNEKYPKKLDSFN